MTLLAKFAFLIGMLLPVSAIANPSFSCQGNLSPAEKTICANPDLAEADRDFGVSFSQALKLVPEDRRGWFVRQQQKWLAQRDVDCGLPFRPTDSKILVTPDPTTCLNKKYRARKEEVGNIAIELKDLDSILFPASRYPFLPSIVKSENLSLCTEFLKSATDAFLHTDWRNISTDRFLDLPISGGRWITLPSGNDSATFEADLDGNGQHSLIFYRSTAFNTGSGNGRNLLLAVQPKVDRSKLAERYLPAYGESAESSNKGSGLVAIPPYKAGPVKWPDFKPVNILIYKNRYYFFDAQDFSQLQQIHSDGTTTLACSIRMTANLDLPKLDPNEENLSREGMDEKFDFPQELKVFFNIVRNMQGNESGYVGTAHFLSRLIFASHEADYNSVIEPWNLLSHPSYGYTLVFSSMSADAIETAIRAWATESISNFHQFQAFEVQKIKAVSALKSYYQDKFGIPENRSEYIASIVVDRLISQSFVFESSKLYPPELRDTQGNGLL